MTVTALIKPTLQAKRQTGGPVIKLAIRFLDLARGLGRLAWMFAFDSRYRAITLLRWFRPNRLHQTTPLTGMNRYPQIFAACRDLFADRPAIRVLSFGCSSGEEVISLRRYFPEAQIVGAEINRGSLAMCLRQPIDDGMSFVLLDPATIARKGPFDLIFCMAVLHVRKSHTAQKAGDGMDITGPFWMLLRTEVLRGELIWRSKGQALKPRSRVICLYVPPFSWTSEHYQKDTHVQFESLFSSLPPPASCPDSPVLFSCNATLPKSMNQVAQLFERDLDLLKVALATNPTSIATRVKSVLDKSYADDPSMAEISKKLKTSGAVLSRQFKAAFGFTPMHYKRGLRITAAMYHLLSGKVPTEVAFLSGYRDIGRFYKQFKQYKQQTPDSHRIKKSKNAKT